MPPSNSTALDIDAAIGAHTAWKRRFEFCIDGIIDERLNADTISDDTRCVLGCWLFGTGLELADLPLYQELVTTHREFHQIASDITRRIDARDNAGAQALLSTRFTEISAQVISLLKQLRELSSPHLYTSPP